MIYQIERPIVEAGDIESANRREFLTLPKSLEYEDQFKKDQ